MESKGNVVLRDKLKQKDILIVPGVFDALSASVAAKEPFDALYMSGFAVAASLLAEPDIGLVSASQMIERAAQVKQACGNKLLIADGDNGYGGVFNVERIVQAYEQVGVNCIQLEDQVSPKRCGHMENKEVVSCDEAAKKIAAAVAARNNSDFLIMARTDARATHDMDEALRRAEAFLNAGADILFVEAPRDENELRLVSETFPGVPLVANMVEDGKTQLLPPAELNALGYKILLRPVSALLTVTASLKAAYAQLYSSGDTGSMSRLTFSEMNEHLGLNEYIARG